jgi:hypothetical protein
MKVLQGAFNVHKVTLTSDFRRRQATQIRHLGLQLLDFVSQGHGALLIRQLRPVAIRDRDEPDRVFLQILHPRANGRKYSRSIHGVVNAVPPSLGDQVRHWYGTLFPSPESFHGAALISLTLPSDFPQCEHVTSSIGWTSTSVSSLVVSQAVQ